MTDLSTISAALYVKIDDGSGDRDALAGCLRCATSSPSGGRGPGVSRLSLGVLLTAAWPKHRSPGRRQASDVAEGCALFP